MRVDEFEIQAAICDYLRWQYPDVVWQSDWSGIKLPIGQAKKAQRIKYGASYPDLFVAAPRGDYHGLYLEIKAHKGDYLRKDGTIRQTAHVQGQLDMLLRLRNEGYKAEFVAGLSRAIKMIDDYLGAQEV